MIIAQYGKMIIWCLRKWVLHNLAIGSTLPNTKNFFLAMFCWIVMRNNGEKEWAAHRAALVSAKTTYIHTVKQLTLWAVSVLCMYSWNLADFEPKHRHPPLTRLQSCCKDTIFSRMDNHLSKKKSYLQTKNEFLSLLEAQNEQCNALRPYHGDEHYD